VVGFAGGTVPTPPLHHALVKNYTILGLHWACTRSTTRDPARRARRVVPAADSGAIAPLVGGQRGLAEAADGLTRLAAGQTVGRLVVVP